MHLKIWKTIVLPICKVFLLWKYNKVLKCISANQYVTVTNGTGGIFQFPTIELPIHLLRKKLEDPEMFKLQIMLLRHIPFEKH